MIGKVKMILEIGSTENSQSLGFPITSHLIAIWIVLGNFLQQLVVYEAPISFVRHWNIYPLDRFRGQSKWLRLCISYLVTSLFKSGYDQDWILAFYKCSNWKCTESPTQWYWSSDALKYICVFHDESTFGHRDWKLSPLLQLEQGIHCAHL